MRRRSQVAHGRPHEVVADSVLLRPPAQRRSRAAWIILVATLASGAGLIAFVQLAGHGQVLPASQARPLEPVEVALEEVPPTPATPPTEPVEGEITEAATAVAPVAPSIGLVEAGEVGGSGDGAPGPALDLSLGEGAVGGMAVASGGGGSGGGVGTGTGSGIGTSRFVYQPGETDTEIRLLKLVDPAYPRRAREEGVEVVVELRLLVDERGRVETVEVSGAPPGYGFEAAIRGAVGQWRFEAATVGGVPVRAWTAMRYKFELAG